MIYKTIFADNKYGSYCVPFESKHRKASQAVLDGRVWEPDIVEFIRDNCPHDLIHAGAYFGDSLPAYKDIEYVWAFEPNKVNWLCARRTIKMNELENVALFNKALGSKSGKGKLAVERNGIALGGVSSICRPPDEDNVLVEVDVVTIDEIVPKTSMISIIHLDVEDVEIDALRGGVETIERCSPILILETPKRRPTPKDHQVFMDKYNYKQIALLNNGGDRVWKRRNR